MKNADLTDGRAKEVIFDAFARNPILPRRLFPIVSGLYFDDDEQRAKFPDRTLWGLNNAFTEAVKILKPSPQAERPASHRPVLRPDAVRPPGRGSRRRDRAMNPR